MKFNKKTRKRLIGDFLEETGNEEFNVLEFINWLSDKPNHIAFDAFYGKNGELLPEVRVLIRQRWGEHTPFFPHALLNENTEQKERSLNE